ncbi:hypothetical protein [Serratia sp. JSRIV006]|uniref:hypothetical protein n=1 Tax=Serratia sp. JSRIV006 TaxID=2831896 RepID=UPI001CBF7CEA|nr:hypothetical protein [Serratia sp. JSRIV006]UAN63407.1 hypothetical protein KGP16_02075 [Serratia sp. JSRIV006]
MQINPLVLRELEYIVMLHREYGAPVKVDSVGELINYILACVADGSCRPGAWERGMLMQMGLIADCAQHAQYRAAYGQPMVEPRR